MLRRHPRMKRKLALAICLPAVALLAGGLWLSNLDSPDPNARWYDERQVAAGEPLYRQHCAVCHGRRAVGTANWRRKGAGGAYPPPPLNGTAHTWHHPLAVLRRTIDRGGAPLGGVMPAFGGKLDDEERDAIIAYIQSLWPDETHRIWAERVEKRR